MSTASALYTAILATAALAALFGPSPDRRSDARTVLKILIRRRREHL